jgi:PleD family two-component response regulator
MKKLVFVVDDNLAQQKVLQIHLEQVLGDEYAVKTFTDPKDMFGHLSKKPYAIVLDHFFADDDPKTGLDYLKEVRKQNKSLPVIYYTSLEDKTIRDQVMKLGVEDYIIKNSASLVRLRTALDVLNEKKSKQGLLRRWLKK